MFLLSFFWLLGLQCLLLPLPIPLPFLMPSLHSVLFTLSRKICKILRALSISSPGFPMLEEVGILPLLFSFLEDLLFLPLSEREEPWAGCWAMNSLWGWGSLSGMHGEPERAHPLALGPAGRVRRETEMDQRVGKSTKTAVYASDFTLDIKYTTKCIWRAVLIQVTDFLF